MQEEIIKSNSSISESKKFLKKILKLNDYRTYKIKSLQKNIINFFLQFKVILQNKY